MKKNYPNPQETFTNNAPVVVSSSDATGIAPNMPLGDEQGLEEDLGGQVPSVSAHVAAQQTKYGKY